MNLPKQIITFPENSDIKNLTRVKFGIDPTFPKLHLGHLVALRIVNKLRDMGKDITIVLGTFTAQLGDPSGKDKTRPILNSTSTEINATLILDQLYKILGTNIDVFKNGTIFKDMPTPTLLNLCSNFTVKHMLSRDSFQKRIESDEPIALHELIVPICQGYDSLYLETEIEIGGTDQLFNFQVARKLQEDHKQTPEICLMIPIINGTDGRKMSKSLDNCIYLKDLPRDVFGKCMSISDETMNEWIPLLTDLEDLPEHPMERKKLMAKDIVRQLYDEESSELVYKHFQDTIQDKNLPDEIKKVIIERNYDATVYRPIIDAVTQIKDCSKSEARRLLLANAVSIKDNKITDFDYVPKKGDVIKVGKRNFGEIIN